MADGEDISQVVEEIADRVRRRIQAARVGKEEPCTAVPAGSTVPEPRKAAGDAECAPECGGCPNVDSSATVFAAKAGAGRIAPDRIRTSADIAPYIDHTLLKPDATREDVVKLSEEARKYGFATVCVNSANVGTAARVLSGSKTVPIAVVGFPLGAALPSAKAFEAREAIRCGAREIDMVINIGALKNRDFALVLNDIQAVVNASRPTPVKVILETSQLGTEEKIAGCALAQAAGAAVVKNSPGFSGGVRSAEDAMKMIAAGANRIGASASVAIVSGQKSTAKY